MRFGRGAAALSIAAAVNGALLWALVRLNEPVDRTAPDQPPVRLVTYTTAAVRPPQPVEPEPEPQPPAEPMTVNLDMKDQPPPVPQPLNMDLDLDLAVASVDPVYIPVIRRPAPPKPQPAPRLVAAPAAPPVSGPLDAERVDEPPRELSNAQPTYPRSALNLGREGAVTVKLLIDEQGEVREADVVQVNGHPAFREAVLDAVRRWRFIPARHRQKAVQVWAIKTIRFELGE